MEVGYCTTKSNHEEEQESESRSYLDVDDDDAVLSLDDQSFKAFVVSLILARKTERAVELVSKKHRVKAPTLSIGHTKGKKIALAVYSVAANTISFSDQDQFFAPFVVLHEMYHCIRSRSGNHRGTEKNADRFALDYIEEYNKRAKQIEAALDIQKLMHGTRVD